MTKIVLAGRVRQVFFLTVKIVWEFAGADSGLVVLDDWLSYRGGHFKRFDCTMITSLIFKTVTVQISINIINTSSQQLQIIG